MNARELFEHLKERQVKLWQDGKMLRFRAPENALSGETIALLRKHKNALLKILQEEDNDQEQETSRLEPAAVNQQAMYFLHLSAPYSPAYNVASACRIRSVVNVEAMRKCFATMIARHDSLRTTFELAEGDLRRRIHTEGELDFAVLNCENASPEELDEQVRREYEQPFDLRKGPLLRVRLFQIAEDEFVFLIALHHIIFDAWSLWLLQDELRTLYAQFNNSPSKDPSADSTALLPVPEALYGDYVREQVELEKSATGEEMWNYWQNRLAGDLPSLDLPTDHPRPKRGRMAGASHKFRVPANLTQQLRDLAKESRVTPFVLMLGIFKTLLSRYSGQDDVIVGTTTSGRSKTSYTRVVGYFVNTLAIRSNLGGDPTFTEYLGQLKTHALDAIKHQDYPYPLLVNKLNPQRGERLPICNVMFGLQKPQKFQEVTRLLGEESASFDMGGLEVHPFDLDQQEGQFDLTLEMFETGETFLAHLKYDVDLFEAETAERISEHYLQLARDIVANPQKRLSEFSILGPAEREQLDAFASGGTLTAEVLQVEAGSLAHQLFEVQVAGNASKVAVVCEDQQLTYAELNQQANQMARVLRNHGLQQGGLVACCYDRGIHTSVLPLAVMKAGGVYTPLDASSPVDRTVQMIQDCGAALVICDTPLPEAAEKGVTTEILDLDDLYAEAESQETGNLDLDIPADAFAYVLYTSGSTGKPKGVCVSHAAFHAHLLSVREAFGLNSQDVVLQFSNLTFDPSLEQMFAPWSLGAKVVARGESLWAPDTLWNEVAKHKLTMINLPPEYFKHCSEVLPDASEVASLRLIILGGDVFPVQALTHWRDHHVQILNAYGPTEAVITATVFDATEHNPEQRTVPIGRPKPGSFAYVLDPTGQPVPIGVAGELCLGGPMLATGYLNDPELSAAKFVADPFASHPDAGHAGAKMYRTGDQARWRADGSLEFLGRADRQIKIHGMRVETGEIECVLASVPGMKQAFVAPREDANGLTYLVAWVVVDGVCAIDEVALRSQLQSKLPRHMVPRQFVQMTHLPINAAGKIDASLLPEPAQTAVRSASCEYVAPRTPQESLLATIWSDELNVKTVGVKDNFFDLGGASLTSLRIVSRASEEGLHLNGEPLKPELLFEYPTVGELAAYLDSQN